MPGEKMLIDWDEVLIATVVAHVLIIEWTPDHLGAMKECVDADSSAKSAMATLTRAGCDEQILLKSIYMYSGGSPGLNSVVPENFGWPRRDIVKTSGRLHHLAEEVLRCCYDAEKGGIEIQLAAPAEIEQVASLRSQDSRIIRFHE